MKFAFVICVLPLFVLMLFQRSASIVNVMPGQTVDVVTSAGILSNIDKKETRDDKFNL